MRRTLFILGLIFVSSLCWSLDQISTVTLTWTDTPADPAITSHNIYRTTTSGGPYTVIGTTDGVTTTYQDHPISDGTYYYAVTAVNPLAESIKSSEATANFFFAACTTAPAAFTATAGSITSNSAVISWSTPGCDSASFVAYSNGARDCCDNPQTITWQDTPAGTSTHAVTLTGLVPNTTYKYYACSAGFTSGLPDTAKDTCYQSGTFTTSTPPVAATLDYDAVWQGPTHIKAGYSTNVKLQTFMTQVTSGFSFENLNLTFTLPAGITMTPFNLTGADTWNVVGTNVLRLRMQSNTPVALVFTADPSASGASAVISIAATTTTQSPPVTHTFTYTLNVDPAPSFTFATPTSYPTITNKASWESWMTTYGAFYCAQDYGFQINPAYAIVRPNNSAYTLCGIGVENCSWYYDGGWVYWQVRDYDQAHSLTGNPTQWNQCIANVDSLYRDGYVIPNNGRIPGYTVLPFGETQDWLRNSDTTSQQSVNLMTTSSAYGTSQGTLTNASALIETDQIRENAYLINACRSNVQSGNVCSSANLNFYINNALGHISQWVDSGSMNYNQPFMSGLEMEALIRAYEGGLHDPRIPAAVKQMWDYLYANAWQKDSSGNGFYYNSYDYDLGISHSDMRPLNLMIAPASAWLFKSGGSSTYSTQALAVFDGWVSNGTNNFDSAPYGKTFSQGYRWSFDLMSWLSSPSGTTVTVSPSSVTIPVLGTQQFSSNPTGATWTKSSGCTGSIGASTGAFTASSTPETCQVTATVSGNSGSGTVTSQAVSVLPATVSLQVGANQTFTSNFPGVWSVSGGSITQAGVYTAPQVNGTYTVTLAATNGGSTGTASVTVTGQQTFIPLTTSPTSWNYGSVAISTPSSKQFTISNIGTGTVTINTQAITVGGTKFAIDTNTCGATLAGGASCTFNVTFNSSTAGSFSGNLQVADSAGGTTNVPLTATVAGATVVSVTPTSVTLPYSGIQQFSANVAVTWATSCVGGGGSITSVGFFTAPAAATTCTVTATASDGSGANAQANVTVNALSVNPVAVTLQVNSKQQFTANFAASWAVTSGTCTISAGGLLTAPGTNTSCIVRATAQNGGSTATASVSVVGAPSSTPGTQLQTVTMDAGTIR